MEKKITIQRNSVQETLIIPLFARKICSELYANIYSDAAAVELVDRLDYDFTELNKKAQSLGWRFGALETAARQLDMAAEVKLYLAMHPEAAVVNMGCGLDQTGENCDNGMCRIYNLDFPDVIAVRNEMLPPKERVTNIPADLNATDWYEKIDSSKGVIFFAAGVFYYFDKPRMQALLNNLGARFPGGTIVFDAAGKAAVKKIKGIVKGSGIDGVDSMFYVGSLDRDLRPWLKTGKASSKGYMLGYHSLKDPSVSFLFRLMARLADGPMKMKIVKIEF